jgi:hypothetical protein
MQMQIWSNVQALLALFGGGVFVIGTIVAAAYGLFKIFGENWLDSRFAERREALKHEQQKELEALKVQIARLIDRATKLNQREFEAIPEAWARLYEAFERTRSLGALLETYPDIDNMTSERRNEFIGRCKLEELEKKELSSAENKTDYYRKRIFWHRFVETQEYARELYMYVRKNSILMPIDIRKQFQKLDQLIRSALIDQEHNHRFAHEQIIEEWDKFVKDGETIMTNLEKAIEQRLSSLAEGESL